MVESGDAAPKSCLPSLEMRTTTAAGGSVPTGKTSTATKTNFNQPHLRFYSTEQTDSEVSCKKGPTPSASGNCLLPPSTGGSLRQNPGEIRRLIQAVRKVIPAPARFWDRDARWFVVRLYVLEQLGDELQQFLEDR